MEAKQNNTVPGMELKKNRAPNFDSMQRNGVCTLKRLHEVQKNCKIFPNEFIRLPNLYIFLVSNRSAQQNKNKKLFNRNQKLFSSLLTMVRHIMPGKTGLPFRFVAALQTLEFRFNSTLEALMLSQIFIGLVPSTALAYELLIYHFFGGLVLYNVIGNRLSGIFQDDIVF